MPWSGFVEDGITTVLPLGSALGDVLISTPPQTGPRLLASGRHGGAVNSPEVQESGVGASIVRIKDHYLSSRRTRTLRSEAATPSSQPPNEIGGQAEAVGYRGLGRHRNVLGLCTRPVGEAGRREEQESHF